MRKMFGLALCALAAIALNAAMIQSAKADIMLTAGGASFNFDTDGDGAVTSLKKAGFLKRRWESFEIFAIERPMGPWVLDRLPKCTLFR